MNAARRIAVLLVAGLPALLFTTPAVTSADEKPAARDPEPLGLVADRHASLQLQAAADFSRDGDSATAIRLLQHVLDGEQDVLVLVGGRYVGARAEAERQLAALPMAAREAYQRSFGARAAELLVQARQTGDAELLARVARRYPYTDAGASALQALASRHAAARHWREAAGLYGKLLHRLDPARWSTEDLYSATLALHREGLRASAGRTEKLLFGRAEQDVIRLSDRKVKAEEVRKEIEQAAPAGPPEGWPIFGGDPTRSARGVGGLPFLSAVWRHPMLYHDDKENPAPREKLREAVRWSHERNQPIIPAFAPITVPLIMQGKRLIYRNYWGVVARDLKTGQIAWASPSSWSLERMLAPRAEPRKLRAMTDALTYYVSQGQQPQILWENSTVGTLSTDGRFLYAVEDLAVPPPQAPDLNMGFPGGANPNTGYGPEVQDAMMHSRLQAYSLANSGKLTFELGGDEKGPLGDCYFLGPPLPLGGKLYLLTEKQQELRLVCLEVVEENRPAAGVDRLVTVPRVVSTQTLGKTPENLRYDVPRRTTAAHLAYDDGILVCPSNAGVVFGVDVVGNAVAWAYPYRDKGEGAAPQRFDRRGRPFGQGGVVIGPDGRVIPPVSRRNQWQASAPIIADGKVVFTPPDSASIHCVNLRDGSPRWSRKKRDDDVYLGGVYDQKVLIVGKRSVEALSLDAGRTLWTVETGMPSGHGIASGDVFYLPLAQGAHSKRPEICAIDMRKGQVVARARSRPDRGGEAESPGNLLFAGGDLISLSAREVAVYPQLKVKITGMDERLDKHPNDPAALAERGELRRDRGDLAGAITDFRAALKNTPDRDTRRRVRSMLFDALTESYRRDPREADRQLEEYEELCATDPIASAEDQAEQKRRRGLYLLVVARLRESQGRPKDALNAYLDLLALGPADEMVAPEDDPGVRVRRDVWVRGRIADLLRRATPEQRKQLDDEIVRRLKEAEGRDDPGELRDLSALFGTGSAAGREAHLRLAERLTERREFLEAELLLQQVPRWTDDPVRSARALERLGQLMLSRGLPADAAYYYRLLRREHGETVLPGGRTGARAWEELAADKRLLPYLEPPAPFADKLKTRKEEGSFLPKISAFRFEHDGEEAPFFRRHLVAFGTDDNRLRLLDAASGEEIWTHSVPLTSFRSLVALVPPQSLPRLHYHTIGHMAVVAVDHVVLGLDPVARRVLWEKDVLSTGRKDAPGLPGRGGPSWSLFEPDPPEDGARLSYPDGWVRHVGQELAVSHSVLCLATRQGLQAIDPLTGRLVWARPDVLGRVRIFGDEEHVFVVEDGADGRPASTRVYRLADGGTVPVPGFATPFAGRRQRFGRFLLQSDRDDGVRLRLYDVAAGAYVWQTVYRPGSLLLLSEDPHLTGAVEPDGKVHVVDLRQRKEVMTGQMADPAENLRNVRTVHLLADRRHFYLACEAPPASALRPGDVEVQSNVVSESGLRDVPVNGRLYALERESGEVFWHALVRNQRLVLDPSGELPVLFFTAHLREERKIPTGGERYIYRSTAMSIEKRSGRLLFEGDITSGSPFYAVRPDPKSGTVTFLSPSVKIVHYPANSKPPTGK